MNHWKTKENLLCRGSYEKAFVNWANSNEIDFEWQIPFKMPDGTSYWIDALITSKEYAGIYIEIKGYFWDDAQRKWKWFNAEHIDNSQLWDTKKLKEIGILPKKRTKLASV